MNISTVNLNLLLVLDALLVERHVSRAARRLGLSQPAVSNALGQLRTLFGDPLLVRTSGRMIATERALALAQPVAAALAAVQDVLAGPAAFDPARAERRFVIAATDFVEFVLLPRLLGRVGREAPGVRLQIVGWPHHRVPPTLETGDVDLMIGFFPDVPPHHFDTPLFRDEFVCIVRKNHPRVGARLTLKRYAELQHVLVTSESTGPGVVDIELAKRGLQRSVGLRISHFLMVPSVIAATDMVAAVGRRVAEAAARSLPLRILPPPLPLPRGTIGQVWHERTHTSPAHAWLRGVVEAIAQGV